MTNSNPRPRYWIAAALFLHALCALRYPWEPDPWYSSWLRLSLDLVALLSVGWALANIRWNGRWIDHLLAAAFLLVPSFRFGATIIPKFYFKELDVYNDIAMAPGLAHLLLHDKPGWVQTLIWVGVALACILLYAATYRSVRSLRTRFASTRSPWTLPAVGALTLAAGGVDLYTDGLSSVVAPPLLDDAAIAAAEIVPSWQAHLRYGETLEKARVRTEAPPHDLRRLANTDVFLFFVESYGRCIFREELATTEATSWLRGWEAELRELGLSTASSFCFPSVHGGNSSMAHAEFLSGAQVANRRSFDELLESDLPAMPALLRDSGHVTFNVQPAMPIEWPEGAAFFGFHRQLFESDFPYTGVLYPWGKVPDQFALARASHEWFRKEEQPIFVQYVGVTSHAPFSMTPPYYEDWEVARDSKSFERAPAREYDIAWSGFADNPVVQRAYLDTIQYSLRTMFDFAGDWERDALFIIVGDHQPPYITGFEETVPDAHVPIHVVARNPEHLIPFAQFGFRPGLLPEEDVEPFSTSLFLSNFLWAFSEGDQ